MPDAGLRDRFGQRALENVAHRRLKSIEAQEFELKIVSSRSREQLPRQADRAAERLSGHADQSAVRGIAVSATFHHQFEAIADDLEEVVQIVRRAGGEFADVLRVKPPVGLRRACRRRIGRHRIHVPAGTKALKKSGAVGLHLAPRVAHGTFSSV